MLQKRSLLLALVIGLISLLAVPTFAQDNTTPLPGTIRVSGTGTVSTAPDTATVIVGITVVDTDLKTAYTNANDQVAAIIAAVQEVGVPVEDIRTFNLNIYQDSSMPPVVSPAGASNGSQMGGSIPGLITLTESSRFNPSHLYAPNHAVKGPSPGERGWGEVKI